MRKKQKEQVENFIGLLKQAHGQLKKIMEKQDFSAALELLEECQNGAIAMGNLIENTEGEGCRTISMLEDYCEEVYQVYEAIESGRYENAGKAYKALRKSLVQIENSVHSDIKVKRVAVFLPYKASMWDSLESVWKAADTDAECDAYVIPVPYYDKNPDGSFKEAHYEGGEYPAYVPVTRYDAFDFEGIHPDMIFIHNPYDEYNYVTSVHPFFYAANLKKFTDNLIYIPYFVLNEVEPGSKRAAEAMENFCMVPGVFHADKVIVQSKAMRQVYIDILAKAAGENSRKLWEKIILGLGSPKFDKVTKGEKEESGLPEEWADILRKPDGKRKKIILYNTSVTALLKYEDRMLKKMESVFQLFRENQSDAVLWWRPHPLIKATIESMRPQLYSEYEKTVRNYLKEGWGIYDDTADLNRAIRLSDAYYGDASSLVQLYQKTGRPIMIQNVNYL